MPTSRVSFPSPSTYTIDLDEIFINIPSRNDCIALPSGSAVEIGFDGYERNFLPLRLSRYSK